MCEDPIAIQGAEQHWELCPFPGWIFLEACILFQVALIVMFLAHRPSQKQYLDMKCHGNAVLGVKKDTETAPEGKHVYAVMKAVVKGVMKIRSLQMY